MRSRMRTRWWVLLGALLALALLVGTVSAGRLADSSDSAPATTARTTTQAEDPYPLSDGPTPAGVQLSVFERAYSECATSSLEILAEKYKLPDDASLETAAARVGRAWASYFRAGPDAVQDGRDGCLQGAESE
jgi:hypothetical protein